MDSHQWLTPSGSDVFLWRVAHIQEEARAEFCSRQGDDGSYRALHFRESGCQLSTPLDRVQIPVAHLEKWRRIRERSHAGFFGEPPGPEYWARTGPPFSFLFQSAARFTHFIDHRRIGPSDNLIPLQFHGRPRKLALQGRSISPVQH